ncbi:MAG: sigma-70 family RNA polymerase sigma factor [Candidatus Zixiibacteriota bacterium]
MNNLVTMARNGDLEAEKQLFQYLRVRFEYLAKKRLLKKEDAEDIAQEACLTVIEKYRTVDFHGQFNAWALKVLRNKIGNYLQGKCMRDNKVAREVDVGALRNRINEPVDMILISDLSDCLRKLLAAFPRYARALNLVHLGFTTDDICRRLDIKPNNLYVILNRGRQILKECLGKE